MAVLTVTIKEEVTLNGSVEPSPTLTQRLLMIYTTESMMWLLVRATKLTLKFGTADGGTIADSDPTT